MTTRPAWLTTLMLIGLSGSYALCFTVIKAGLAFAPPLLFSGLRALVGGVALLGLTIVFRKPFLPPHKSWGGVLAMSLAATSLGYGAMFLSPGRTGAGIASVLGNTQPLLVVVLAAMFLGERMTPGRWITLALGLAGVTLIAWQALVTSNAYGLSGAALALAASAGAAVGSVIFKRMQVTTGLLAVTAWQLILGSLPLLAISALSERSMPVIWNFQFVGQLLFLALVGTALVSTAWYWLVQRGQVSHLALFLFLVPVFGLGIAALVFGERVSLLEIVGSLLTVAGIGIAAIAPRSRHPAVQAAL